MMKTIVNSLFLLLILTIIPRYGEARQVSRPATRFLHHPRLDSKALRGNLIGDPSEREMLVLLPPSYYFKPKDRFPVVFLLHGLGKRKDGHLLFTSLFEEMFARMKEKALPEMILVGIDGTTIFGGSYYTSSPTIGNFESYIVDEIVPMTDSLYRTKPSREWRAVAGFSMGGHGALKLSMKYNGVFSQAGSLSGSPLSIRYRKQIYRNAIKGRKPIRSLDQLLEEITYDSHWSLAAAYAKAAAFSPNPQKPPLYLDLPFQTVSEEDDTVWQKWWDDDPLGLVSKYRKNLTTLDQIYIDQGDDETTLGTEDFDRELMRYGIGHTHYVFRGDHVDRMDDRYLRMLQHFAIRWSPR